MRRFLWIITVISGLLLLAAAHSRYIDPEDFWPAGFLGLVFMPLLILNIFLLLFWTFKWSRKSFFTILAILLSYPTLQRYVQITFLSNFPPGKEEKAIRVMSYNVRVFDLYNWSNNLDSKSRMMDLIGHAGPDILCIQEFFHSERKNYFATRDTLAQVLGGAYSHLHYTTTLHDSDHWGIATYTRYPVIAEGVVDLPDSWNNACIWTDVVAHNDTIRIYNVHLASVGLKTRDYKLLEDIKDEEDEEEMERTRGIFSRLRQAFVKRGNQAEILRAHMDKSPHPVIVCGDFNDTPASYAYRQLKKGMFDAFVEKGNGLGITYPKLFPAYRIDYILTSPQLVPVKFRTIREEHSDHYPVVLDLFVR